MLNSSPTMTDLPRAISQPKSHEIKQQESSVVDGELLRSFLRTRDETAFQEIVERFGPLVMGIVLRILRDQHSAEDAFQATFLILARDVKKIRKPESIRSWLHGTAIRVAKTTLKRRQKEVAMLDVQLLSDQNEVLDDIHSQFQQKALDEELQNLPERYRAPLILHFLEGLTCEETAAALGMSTGAIRGRIQRGKQELKSQLLRRGIELATVVAGLTWWQTAAQAAVNPELTLIAVDAGLAALHGTPVPSTCSPEAVQIAAKEVTMISNMKLITTGLCVAAASVCGWLAHIGYAANQIVPSVEKQQLTSAIIESTTTDLESTPAVSVAESLNLVAFAGADDDEKKSSKPQLIVKYDDGKPDGRKSIAGTGEMIQFKLPDARQKLRSIRIHCSRYGLPQPPDEDVEISIVSEENTDVIHTEFVPYAKFKRGESRWITIPFEESVDVPETFWVIAEFNAARTKGVYVSYDSSTDGPHSKTGVPGGKSAAVSFEGDWMIQAILTKPE